MNQRSPVPLTRMPQSVPLRAMMVTTVQPGMFSAGSSIAFIAGIERFRKKWSLPSMKRSTAATVAASGTASTSAGAIVRIKSEVPALLRLWHSSPMCSAWAIMLRRSIGPLISSAAFSAG